MILDFSGAEVFLGFLAGRVSLATVLEHPAYRHVAEHARRYGGSTIDEDSVLLGLLGKATPFYGLATAKGNLPRIRELIAYLKTHEDRWLQLARDELARILPAEPVQSLVVYPIIGYDAGIGLDGAVCMSLNCSLYHESPDEFLSTMIHEAFHVLYERIHGPLDLAEVISSLHWQQLLLTMVQNEGLAVYAPLMLRRRLQMPAPRKHPMQLDYYLLERTEPMDLYIDELGKAMTSLADPHLSSDERLLVVFGPERLTYRAGARFALQIESKMGTKALQKSIYGSPEEFLSLAVSLKDS